MRLLYLPKVRVLELIKAMLKPFILKQDDNTASVLIKLPPQNYLSLEFKLKEKTTKVII